MKPDITGAKRLYLQVAEQLSAQIRAGAFETGGKLPAERELAKLFEVSRPTIREAITTLEVMGLVEVRPGSGVYVRDLESATTALPENVPGPFEILEARITLEPELAAFAANRIDDVQLERLKDLLHRFGQPGLGTDQIERIDREFHALIAESTRNSALAGMMNWLWDVRAQSEVNVKFYQRVRDRGLRPAVDDHRAITAALLARNAKGARNAMREHLENAIADLSEMSLD